VRVAHRQRQRLCIMNECLLYMCVYMVVGSVR
jgi:hypothetical protein